MRLYHYLRERYEMHLLRRLERRSGITALFKFVRENPVTEADLEWDRKRKAKEAKEEAQRRAAHEEATRPYRPYHSFVMAGSRKGKSVYLIQDGFYHATRGRFVLFEDGHGPAAREFLARCLEAGFGDRVIFDDLSRTDSVVGYDFFPRSTSGDPLTRLAENKVASATFIDILCREQGVETVGPLKGQYLRLACSLWANQQEPLPLAWLTFGLMPMSAEFDQMISNCTDDRTVRELLLLKQFKSPQYLDEILGPARRALDPLFDSVAFFVRAMVLALSVKQAIRDGKIIILAGSGMVTKAAMRQIMASCATSVYRACQEHFDETGEMLPAVVIQDECNAFDLIREAEVTQNAQSLKFGMSRTMSFQYVDRADPLTDGTLQNCDVQVFFGQGSRGCARLGAEQIATRLIERNKIIDIEERERSVVDSYSEIPMESESVRMDHNGNPQKTRSSSTTFQPNIRKVVDEVKTRESMSDQILEFERKLLTMRAGYRLWTNGTHTTENPEYLKMLGQTWITKTEVNAFLMKMRSKPPFQTPSLGTSRRTGRGGASQTRRNGSGE